MAGERSRKKNPLSRKTQNQLPTLCIAKKENIKGQTEWLNALRHSGMRPAAGAASGG